MVSSLDADPGERKAIDRAGTALAQLPSVRVVLFSGGRGSGALSRLLLKSPHVQLTLAINGYDDGASTGTVRRFLGDSLGPSDFRKNASRIAGELATCPPSLIEMLDARLPDGLSREAAVEAVRLRAAASPAALDRIEAFLSALSAGDRPFSFDDCSVGNLVFAGCFLRCHRRFNDAVDDYCALVGLPPGLVENVTSGENAQLVALSEEGAILGSEEEIVATAGRNRIQEIFLVDRTPSDAERNRLRGADPATIATFFGERRQIVTLNPRLAARLAEADLIIYAPGTQHSSLFPSYLTPGLGEVIARNLKAIKLLITNIQTDAEILGASAVDIIGRALYYLNEKGSRTFPTPCLITHYVVNDPARVEASAPYVPLGQIETLEDPRLVRIANFEEGVSGRHDAAKILGPFIRSLVERHERRRLAVVLHDAGSASKVTQTLLEMVRGGISDVAVDVTVFHEGGALDRSFLDSLPFGVAAITDSRVLGDILRRDGFDYALLFESSGMYRGEDIAVLASHLSVGRLDAVWGSRRLSVRDIEESLRFRYEKSPLIGMVSRVGSHLLSLACLLLYGRYVSDTLSAVRAVRTDDALGIGVGLTDPRVNQHLLARLLRRKADLLEIPVQFFPISPERVKRTSVLDGLRALAALLKGRRTAARGAAAMSATETDDRRTTPVPSR
jgi:2-phospho-L-lactate transferase/gluconeogenesis factor (CofD/UPF0052 family)